MVGLTVALALGASVRAEVDTGVIRLGGPERTGSPERAEEALAWEGRRGFDFEEFERRLESLWFQRKAFLADGRGADAERQSALIRNFCTEEGVTRLDAVSGALLSEGKRQLDEGSYERAMASLDLAESFAPGTPQIHFGRAATLWSSGEGYLEAVQQLGLGVSSSLTRAWTGLDLPSQLALVMVIAFLGSVFVFAGLMVFKYQLPFRHEVEEWMSRQRAEAWGPAVGWGILFLPLLTWYLAGWLALYWIVIMFRFMRRGERLTAIVLLVLTAVSVPAFRISVALYGMLTDPAVRITLDSAAGSYSPERVVKLRELVDAHPEDPVYRFLLAGLYKDGRYLDEAHTEYRKVLELDPGIYQAHINVGNIYYLLGQYAEAVAEYGKALALRPDSLHAYYNTYLAQSESFHFREAEESLRRAQQIDPDAATRLLSSRGESENRAMVLDASIQVGSVWRAALEGRPLRASMASEAAEGVWQPLPRQFLNVLSFSALLSVALCAITLVIGRVSRAARRCIRCGRPFCHRCRTGREAQEYCSQCLHLFVIGDGLAPETKTRKMYEVERYDRTRRRVRNFLSLVLPGAAHLIRGRAARGCMLLFCWIAAVVAWQPVVFTPIERAAGLTLHLDFLRAGAVPAVFSIYPAGTVALIAAIAVWVVGNLWRWRWREA
jgi:tetratricopeptide (TPR) repeat protein